MARIITIFLSAFIGLSLFAFSEAAVVYRVKGKKVLLKLKNTKTRAGSHLVVVNQQGKAQGIVKISRVKGKGALGMVAKGRVKKGQMAITKSKYLRLKKSMKRKMRKKKKRSDMDDLWGEEEDEDEQYDEDDQWDDEDDRGGSDDDDDYEEEDRQQKRDRSKKKWLNVKTNIASDAVGFTNIGADVYFWKRWSAGFTYASVDAEVSDVDIEGTLFGARLNYYFNKEAFSRGWYLSGGLGSLSADFTNKAAVKGDDSGFFLLGAGGYLYTWDSFNIGVAAGLINYSLDDKTTNGVEIPLSGVVGTLEVDIGWAF